MVLIIGVLIFTFPSVFPCKMTITNINWPERNSFQITVNMLGVIRATEYQGGEINPEFVEKTGQSILYGQSRWKLNQLLNEVLQNNAEKDKSLVFGDTIKNIYLQIYGSIINLNKSWKNYWSIYQNPSGASISDDGMIISPEVLNVTYWLLENSPLKIQTLSPQQ